MTTSSPWKIGVAMALTLAIAYTVCTVAYALMPERVIDFFNALFYGLDFRKLGAPAPITLMMFIYPLVVFVVWGSGSGRPSAGCTTRSMAAAPVINGWRPETTGTVTGSKHMGEAAGQRVLVDRGLYRGLKAQRLRNWEQLPVEPASVDWHALTHANAMERFVL